MIFRGLLLFIRGLPISVGRIYLLQERLWPPCCCCCVAELSVLIFNWEERGRDTIMSIIGTRYKYHQYTAHGVNTGAHFWCWCSLNVKCQPLSIRDPSIRVITIYWSWSHEILIFCSLKCWTIHRAELSYNTQHDKNKNMRHDIRHKI